MKKFTSTLIVLLSAVVLFAQAPVKRYVTIEHFTNSRCGICASRNPAFYSLIDQYPDDIHHMSVHPSVPYPQCVFYQANTTENNALADRYSIFGTPRIALNGTLTPGGSQLLPAATLEAQLNQTSPLLVQVSETSGNSREVTIQLRTQDEIPAGTYKMYAFIIEKLVEQATPNGENEHHDVFRKMLTPVEGVDYTPAALGYEQTFTYNYDIESGWNADEIFVMALVRDESTGEVLNSGTPFDPQLVSTGAPATQRIQLSPNPVRNTAVASIGNDVAEGVTVFDAAGQQVVVAFENAQGGTVSLALESLAPGLYIMQIQGREGRYVAKFVKE